MIVRVPASSANLGPGFDCLGLAWQLYDEIEFEPSDTLSITGCPEKYRGPENLACRAYRAALRAACAPERAVSIRFLRTEIPVSRGLGSSAALTAAGVLAADALGGLGLSRRALLEIASGVEGHPDNAAPALLGGLTAAAMDGGRVLCAPFPLSERLCFAALVPDFELSTELSRSVLPERLPRADAVFNLSRTALLLKALETGDGELLAFAMEDRVHQPYRRRLIGDYEALRARALDCGALGFCFSGAGSTLLAAAPAGDFPARLAAALGRDFPAWQVRALTPDRHGAAVLPSP